jgi:hypothetical protein
MDSDHLRFLQKTGEIIPRLIASIAGQRGRPRSRPPSPVQGGSGIVPLADPVGEG